MENKMKIVRRNKLISPMSTIPMWLIPTLNYLLLKVYAVQFNGYEYVWGIVIPSMVVLWVLFNWKIKK